MSLTPPAIFDASPSRVLAIYSHPDDADVACGGALARWAAQGADVQLLLLTDGGKGTIDETVLPAQLATVRREEVAAASKELSISGVEHLDIPDGEVGTTADLVETFVRRIRSFRPDVVLGHDPTHHDERGLEDEGPAESVEASWSKRLDVPEEGSLVDLRYAQAP